MASRNDNRSAGSRSSSMSRSRSGSRSSGGSRERSSQNRGGNGGASRSRSRSGSQSRSRSGGNRGRRSRVNIADYAEIGGMARQAKAGIEPGSEPLSEANSGTSWTAPEVQQLRELARQNTPTGVMSIKLGRTEDAIYDKAREIGLSLMPRNVSPYNRQGSRSRSRTRSGGGSRSR